MEEKEENKDVALAAAAEHLAGVSGGGAKGSCKAGLLNSRTALLVFYFFALVAAITIPAVLLTRPNSEDDTKEAPPSGQETASAFSLPDGVWTTRGYGYVLKVADGQVTIMEETAISCIVAMQGPLDYLAQLLYWEDIQVNGGIATVVRKQPGTLPPYVMDRSDAALGGCSDGPTPMDGHPDYVRDTLLDYDILVQTFAQHYAFFEPRGVDWDELPDEVRSDLTSDSTNNELLEAFASILAPLEDAHVSVTGPRDAADWPAKSLGSLEYGEFRVPSVLLDLTEEFEQQDKIDDYDTYLQIQEARWIEIVDSYMDDGLQGEPGSILWGRSSRTGTPVGYIQMGRMIGLHEEDKVDALTEAFSVLSDTDAIVFDIRKNIGGDYRVGLLIASYFASKPYLAFTKYAVMGDGYTDSTDVYVEPLSGTGPGSVYHGKAVVVISGITVSAAEVFTLAMTQLPQTTLLGRDTLGIFSDVLNRHLPNGWLFGVSNEILVAPDGMIYEAVGISPDIYPDAELLPLSEREAGFDSWLELALEEASD